MVQKIELGKLADGVAKAYRCSYGLNRGRAHLRGAAVFIITLKLTTLETLQT